VPSRFSRRVHEAFQLLAQLNAGNGVREIALNVQAIFDLPRVAYRPDFASSNARSMAVAFACIAMGSPNENAAEPVMGSAAKVQRDVRPMSGGRHHRSNQSGRPGFQPIPHPLPSGRFSRENLNAYGPCHSVILTKCAGSFRTALPSPASVHDARRKV
jgi:hypothetical protein